MEACQNEVRGVAAFDFFLWCSTLFQEFFYLSFEFKSKNLKSNTQNALLYILTVKTIGTQSLLNIQQITLYSATCIIHHCSYSVTRRQASIVDWMWQWESFGKQFTKPPLLRGRQDEQLSWLHTLMTSLPFRVWQLSTSSQWQPDECSEWVVTLATAMLSWPSPYILRDSPRWQWAQQHSRQCTHPHSNARRHVHILYISRMSFL